MPEVRSRLRQRRRAAAGQDRRCATRRSPSTTCRRTSASCAQTPARGAHHRHASPTCPTSASGPLNDNGQRDLQLIVAGPTRTSSIETAAKLAARDGDDPDLSNVDLDRAARTGPRSASRRSPRSPPSSASRPTPSPRRCASPPSATSAPTSPSSTPATGRCRSGCSCPRARAATVGCSSVLKVPAKNGAAVPLSAVADVELGQGPTSIDRYDRALRVALEARSARHRRARRGPGRERDRAADGEEPARRRRRSSRPATPRS